jgi:hypothetical protein
MVDPLDPNEVIIQQQRQQFEQAQQVAQQAQTRTTITPAMARSFQNIPQRLQMGQQYKQAKEYGGQVSQAQTQFETQVAQVAPEYATPQYKEQAIQEAKAGLSPRIETIKQEIIARQARIAKTDGSLSETRRDRYEIIALQKELGVYENALNSPDQLLKDYYSGNLQARAKYERQKEQASGRADIVAREAKREWKASGGQQLKNVTVSESVLADMYDTKGNLRPEFATSSGAPKYQFAGVDVLKYNDKGEYQKSVTYTPQKYQTEYAPYKEQLYKWGEQKGFDKLPSFAQTALAPGIVKFQQQKDYQLQFKGMDVTGVKEVASGKVYTMEEYNKLAEESARQAEAKVTPENISLDKTS